MKRFLQVAVPVAATVALLASFGVASAATNAGYAFELRAHAALRSYELVPTPEE